MLSQTVLVSVDQALWSRPTLYTHYQLSSIAILMEPMTFWLILIPAIGEITSSSYSLSNNETVLYLL